MPVIDVTSRGIVVRGAASCVALLFVASMSRAQSADATAADEAAIRTVMDRGAEAFNRHDAAACAAVYTSDADLVNVRGDHLKGRTAIEHGLASAFAGRYKDAQMTRGPVTIRFLRPDVALAHVKNVITGVSGPEGTEGTGGGVQTELGLRVFVKEDGAWRVAALHNTRVAQPPHQ